MRKWLKILIINLLILLISMFLVEIVLRAIGKKAYQAPEVTVNINPPNYGCTHPQLGFSLRPGTFSFQLAGNIKFQANHTRDSLRRTKTLPISNPQKEVHVHGCSLVYGYGVDDEQSFPWRLQTHFSTVEVKNYGISGFSLSQMFARLKHAYTKGSRPHIVIVGYASFHNERNALLRHWRKSLTFREKDFVGRGKAVVPGHRLHWNGIYELKKPLAWQPWPLMRHTALMHALEQSWNDMEFSWQDTHSISLVLLNQMKRWCQKRDIQLVVAIMNEDEFATRTLNFCQGQGFRVCNLAVDERLCGMTFQPFDPHPTALAHRLYAQKLIHFLEAEKLL